MRVESTSGRLRRPLRGPAPRANGVQHVPARPPRNHDAAAPAAPGAAPAAATSAAANARAAADRAEQPPAAPQRRRRHLLLLIPILLVVGLVGLVIGYRYWYESAFFVVTDNAQVTGDLVQIGSFNAGRLLTTAVDVGQPVERNQVVATVAVPQQVGAVPFTDAPLLDETGSTNAQVPVRSPMNGIVAARMANVGATVTAGQAIYALVDPTRVWVSANVEEAKVGRVQPGQAVEVHVDALGHSVRGRVQAVTPASAATFSLLPSQNVAGNYTRVTQWVPVKIAVDSGDEILPLGTSVEVRIAVQEPPGWLPWRP